MSNHSCRLARNERSSVMEVALKKLLPLLIEDGVFGKGVKFDSIATDNDTSIGEQFASEVVTIIVRTLNKAGQHEDVPVVVKVQLSDVNDRNMRDSYSQFHNEVLMYKELLPLLNKNRVHLYPKIYHGEANCGEEPEKDCLVMENMSASGYVIAKEKLFLDYDHIAVTMKRIGEFHAWSYAIKSSDERDKFLKGVKQLKLPNTKPAPDLDTKELLLVSFARGLKPFVQKNVEIEALEKILKAFHFNNFDETISILIKPVEPFAVLAHGDFNKNNIFYKYENGKAIDCAFFDFQLSKYAGPAVDLVFYLYMHTTVELREKYWDDFLEIYWKSFTDNVPSHVQLPTYEEFLDHFAARTIYGYYIVSFWAPMMLLEKPFSVKDLRLLPKAEQVDFFDNISGEYGLRIITDVASHLIERKYIHKFLELYESNFPKKTDS